jgi:hypothetical protein
MAGDGGAVLFYRPECFQILADWLRLVGANPQKEAAELLRKGNRISPALGSYLLQSGFPAAWEKLRKNFPATALLVKAFHQWFDGLKTLKLIRFLSAGPYPPVPPETLVPELLNWAALDPAEGIDAALALLRRLQINGRP